MNTHNTTQSTDVFANAPVPKAVFTNIIPSIISMLMIMIYNLADTFFIAQTRDPLMVAAVSVATPAFFLFMMVGNLFGVGGTSLISRSLGAGDSSKAKKISSFCFWTGLVIGAFALVFLKVFARPITLMIGASENTVGFAVEYLDIISYCIPLLIVGSSFSNIIRAEGHPQAAMFGTVLGNIVNIVLDPILISVFDMGVAGAAWATVLGNVVSAGFYILHLCSKRSMLSIHPKDFAIANGIFTGVMAIGIPAALNSFLMTVSNIVLNSLVSNHGDLAVAGVGVASKVNSIVVMVLLGIGIGIQPLLGYNYGARNKKRFMDILKFSSLIAFIASIIFTIICYCAAGPLVHVFLTDETAFNFGFQFCRIFIYAGPVLGFMFVFMNAIQAMGAAIPATIVSVARQGLVLIPALFIMDSLFHTPNTLLMSVPIADYISTIISIVLFFISFHKYYGQLVATDSFPES